MAGCPSPGHDVHLATRYRDTASQAQAPFFLMANSLANEVTHVVGYLWFFVSYVSLLTFGLILLIVSEFRHSHFVRVKIWSENIPAEEVERERLLRAYWMVMNSAVLLILLLIFGLGSQDGACPAHPRNSTQGVFLYLFGLIALGRDYLDFRWAWPFLYPIGDDNQTKRILAPMTRMGGPKNHARWIWTAIVIIVADVVVLYVLEFWDFRYWTSVCS